METYNNFGKRFYFIGKDLAMNKVHFKRKI